MVTAPPRRKRSKWPGRIVLLAVVAGAVAYIPRLTKKKPIVVATVKVERATVRDEVSSSSAGEVAPERHATVRAELAARVTGVKHRRGDRVKAGEVIVTLDAGDLAARVLQAQATLASQEAQLAQARARKEAAEHSAERARKLAERGAGTTQLSDDAAAAARESIEAVRAAEGMVAQSEAALKLARVSRSKAELTAPFDGLLVEVHPDPGEELAPATPVFEIIDDVRLHVDASIDEADVGRLKLGQPASLKLDALPNRPIEGKLSKIGPAVRKDLKGARTLPVEVEVSDVKGATELGVRSGMSANVDIRVAEKANVVSLPTNVIIGRGAKRSVYRVEGGLAKLHPIEVGLSNWDRTEIVSGLNPGDEVIATLNVKELEDGSHVTTNPADAK
jgi:HlyD family secretion protein